MTSSYTNSLCCIIAISITLVYLPSSSHASDINYDPEQQDGIPVFSAKSLSSPSAFDWTLDSVLKDREAQRRSAVSDEDDDNDDEDKDEQKSGSTNHDSYENPAFGESRTAAKDGEDIEQFFDKHLGPQDAVEHSTGSDEQDVPVLSSPRSDEYDDHYDTAASSPLATILQSILNAHKKPLIIQTSDDDATSPTGEQSGPTSSSQQLATSSSSPAASSPIKNGITSAAAAYLGAAPIAYITPMATNPHPMGSYEQQASHESATEASSSPEEEIGQVREIYISRRPSILGRFQEAYGVTGTHPAAPMRETPIGAASGRVPQDYQQDYNRYPTAASYSSYQQPHESPADDGQVVSYNLSFGGGSADSPDDSAENVTNEDSSSPDEQTNIDEHPYAHQMHYTRNMMHRPSSSVQMYHNQHPAAMIPSGYSTRPLPYSHQASAYSGARYQKDPSEYPSQRYSSTRDAQQMPTRRQLLAQLDQQIKSNALYRQSTAASTPSYTHGSEPKATNKQIAFRQKLAKGDLDTFSSFHSEVDPYKTFTATSHIVDQPDQPLTQPSQAQQGVPSLPRGKNLLIGPVSHVQDSNHQQSQLESGDLLRSNPNNRQVNSRVRRDDSDERDAEEADDDGVWVDDDDDDENRQQSSDLNETSQEPEETTPEPAPASLANTLPPNRSGMVNQPHGYELSPDDLMVYHG